MRRSASLKLTLLSCLLWLSPYVQADILIGNPIGVTGAVAAGVKENLIGAKAVFDEVNAQGGIAGQQLVLKTLDDGFKPEKTAQLAKQLSDEGALALFMTRGTPNTEAVLPLLSANKIPLVGPSTGASHLHQPVLPWVFNVRSSYRGESIRVIEHLRLLGIDRIALIQVGDTFGQDAAQGALDTLKQQGKTPVAHEIYNRDHPDFQSIATRIANIKPQAVLLIGSSAPVAEAITKLRDAGCTAQAYTLSNNASEGFIKSLGRFAHGVVVTQVFPWERSSRSAFVRDAKTLVSKHNVELTQAMMEGIAAAKVLVEGIKRAGKNPTRESVRQALEGIKGLDLGGLTVNYGPHDHTGLNFVDIAIIDREGRFQR